jgi:hypothetical protein
MGKAKIEMMSNDELKERKRTLLNEFENQKSVIAKAYALMLSAKEEYDKIDDLLNKREGNN